MPSSFIKEYSFGLSVSAIGHGLLFLLLGMNLILMPDNAMQPVQLAIEATVIDTSAIRERQEEERQRQQQLERQRQQAESERLERQEAERRKQEETRIAEQRRKEEAERQQAAAERQKAEEQRRKQEDARIAEQRRKEEADRQRQEAERQRQEAETARRQAEMQANLQSELEAEERRLAAVNSGKLAQYISLMAARVERNWVQPASARPGVECVVHVTQIPGGEIVNVRVGSCNGDAAVIRSIEAAVYRASPFPPPPDPSLFDRNLRFTFKPEE